MTADILLPPFCQGEFERKASGSVSKGAGRGGGGGARRGGGFKGLWSGDGGWGMGDDMTRDRVGFTAAQLNLVSGMLCHEC